VCDITHKDFAESFKKIYEKIIRKSFIIIFPHFVYTPKKKYNAEVLDFLNIDRKKTKNIQIQLVAIRGI